MRFLFFIFILLVSINLVYATTLSSSPSSLIFELTPNQEQCQTLTIYSSDYTEDLYSLLRWSEKDVYTTNLNEFTFTAEDLNLNIDYTQEINNFDEQEEIEVCVFGSDLGVYRGSLEYRTGSSESSGAGIGVGVGTWIKVTISETSENSENPLNIGGSNLGGGSSSGGSNPSTQTTENNELTLDELSTNNQENENSNPGITGGVIGAGKSSGAIIAIAFTVILIASALLYYKRKK